MTPEQGERFLFPLRAKEKRSKAKISRSKTSVKRELIASLALFLSQKRNHESKVFSSEKAIRPAMDIHPLRVFRHLGGDYGVHRTDMDKRDRSGNRQYIAISLPMFVFYPLYPYLIISHHRLAATGEGTYQTVRLFPPGVRFIHVDRMDRRFARHPYCKR